jgi:hypothetical protein
MTKGRLGALALLVCCATPGLGWAQESAGQVAGTAVEYPDGASESSVRAGTRGEPSVFSSVGDQSGSGVGTAAVPALRTVKRADFNSDVYYKNKVEFSLESGALPINLPFIFDAFVGGDYSASPQHYTLVPVFPSLRWQMGDVHGPWLLRGNTDMTFTLSVTAIPRGPETLYDAFDLGFRRNFVQPNWRVAPYFEARIGAGFLNAQEPYGNTFTQTVLGNGFAQGQDFTFTMMVGSGFRYNFNGRYSMAIGATYFHVSNAYLSEPKYDDNGINVCGPLIGFNVRLSKPRE